MLFSFIVYFASTTASSAQRIIKEERGSSEQVAIEKLSRAIQFKTIASVHDQHHNAAEFLALHQHLAESFPLVHKSLQKEVVNNYSLLYTWHGEDPELKPILIGAHLDVVPVEAASEQDWQELPFTGVVKEDHIWGRGTLDDKYRVVAILEAVEQLLEKGYKPLRTVYLAFGHDEEIGGERGAREISALLEARDVELEAVFDEGLAVAEDVLPGVTRQLALVGTAAKGSINLKLTVNGEGGHSSAPPKESAIAVLSHAIVKLQQNPFKARMTPTTKETVESLAELLGGKHKFAVRHYWLFKNKILKKLAQDQATDVLIRTKMAPTILEAGEKDNVMPRVASATLNIRILNGEDDRSVLKHVKKAIDDDRVQVEVYGDYTPPSPITKTNTPIFAALKNSIAEIFPDAVVVPALFPGGTDAKHYTNLTSNIFRFAPQVVNREIAMLVHNVNERISVDVFNACIQFYEVLIQNACGDGEDALLADLELEDLLPLEDVES